MTPQTETHPFQTEAKQLLDLMVHAIYSHKDIFLRELISNASDALDRRRFQSLTRPELLEAGTELEIWLDLDAGARTLAVRDNGIGMNRDELVELLGTIAKSGSKEFLRALQAEKKAELPPELIGQFGVGFYSSFMVADRVEVLTRKAGEAEAWHWESSGEGTYTISEAQRGEAGTTVTLHLKPVDSEDGLNDYTEEWVVRSIVKKYSDFVAYPIKTLVTRNEPEKDADGKPKPGGKTREVTSAETLNSMKAIWLRDEKEVTDEEYNEFYKHISHDWNEPLVRIRAKIEGTLEYRMLLFIPSVAPFDLFYRDAFKGVHLYVKRVFILDDCKALLPEYLRFLRGVVDSEDLSLNVSREILQQDRQIQRMRKGIVSKVLSTLEELKRSDTEKYLKLWEPFGRVLKEGVYADPENTKRLLDLYLFASTHDPDKLTSLGEYVERMKEGQEKIYFLAGSSRPAVENSPHLEALVDQGYEVLILTDPVDELWTDRGVEYDGKGFQSVGRGEVDVGEKKDDKDREAAAKEYASILEFLKDKLKDHTKDVRLSSRLRSSAACLVGDVGDLSPQLIALLRASNQEVPETKRILEVNPDHAILKTLSAMFEADRASPRLKDYAELLYGQAVLAEGGTPPNPSRFAKLVSELMVKAGEN